MLWRCLLACGLAAALVHVASAQRRDLAEPAMRSDDPAAEGASSPKASEQKWRVPSRGAPAGTTARNETIPSATPPSSGPAPGAAPRQPVARASRLDKTHMPDDAGQELWEYDITPYTARVTSTKQPEQAVCDWILRETGYEAWHRDSFAFLHASRNRLLVYHTPQMQAVVQDMVDRFVNTEAESYAFSMRVVTLESPDWRAIAHRMLRPIAAQTPGVQAWLLHKEDAALLLAQVSKRSDFVEHSTPHMLINNGQSAQVNKTRSRNYIKDVILRANTWPGYEPVTGQIDEGFKLEFHPLLSLDGKVIDAILKCEIDQVEKLVPVNIDVSTAAARQQQRIEVPQAIAARLHERFHWPADQVLLISLGVVPTPVPPSPGVWGVKVPLLSTGNRADLLVFVKSEGKVAAGASALPATAAQPGVLPASKYQNRYKPPIGPLLR
jgi:hypothetical protein